MTQTPLPRATRLHGGRVLLVLGLLALLALAGLAWLRFHTGGAVVKETGEPGASSGFTAAQMHYDAPEPKIEVPPPKPVDTIGPKLAELLAMMQKMQQELDELRNRKPPVATTMVKEPPRPEPRRLPPASVLFVHHDLKDAPPPPPQAPEYVLAPGATKIPCVVETKIVSDVEGYFTCRVSTNVYDTATRRHLLIPQGSTVLANDQANALIYGSHRMDTISLTLTLPDGRAVDLGKAPVTDQQGVAGLTGDVNNHYWKMFGAVFIGGALRGGMTAMQTAMTTAGGAGQVTSGIASLGNQATSRVVQPYINIRPTITVESGQLAHVLLIKALRLPEMWR